MIIERLKHSHVDSAYALCASLKEIDENPCSFWGYTREYLEGLIHTENKITFVASVDSKVVGIGSLCRGGPFQEHWAEISIATDSSKRRTGIARALAHTLEDYGRGIGLKFIKALILENNQSSRIFFSFLGYEHKATLYHDFMLEKFGAVNDCAYYKILVP